MAQRKFTEQERREHIEYLERRRLEKFNGPEQTKRREWVKNGCSA